MAQSEVKLTRGGTVAFVVLTILLATIGILYSTQEIFIFTDMYKYKKFFIFIVILILIDICISFGSQRDDNFKTSSVLYDFTTNAILFLPMVFAIRTFDLVPQQFSFWVSVLVWIPISIYFVFDCLQGWPSVLLKLSAINIAVSLYFILGKYGPIKFAIVPLERVVLFNQIFDAKNMLTYIIVFLFISTAINRSFSSTNISIYSIPIIGIPWAKGMFPDLLSSILDPFVAVFNVILKILSICINYIYKTIAVIVIYMYNAGVELGKLALEMFYNKKAAIGIAKIIILIISSVALIQLSICLTYPLELYIINDILSEEINILFEVTILILSLLSIISIMLFSLITSKYKINNLLSAFSFILISILISGLPLHIATRLNLIEIKGFHQLGPFSIGLITVIIIGFATIIVRKILNSGNVKS